MLNTYIKNRGITKTIIQNGKKNQVSESKWDVDYDGDVANISIDTEANGIHQTFHTKLNNRDLVNLLNIPSVDMPLHKRLENDFLERDNLIAPITLHKKTTRKRRHRKSKSSKRRRH